MDGWVGVVQNASSSAAVHEPLKQSLLARIERFNACIWGKVCSTILADVVIAKLVVSRCVFANFERVFLLRQSFNWR